MYVIVLLLCVRAEAVAYLVRLLESRHAETRKQADLVLDLIMVRHLFSFALVYFCLFVVSCETCSSVTNAAASLRAASGRGLGGPHSRAQVPTVQRALAGRYRGGAL
jgi:hypothetical protein